MKNIRSVLFTLTATILTTVSLNAMNQSTMEIESNRITQKEDKFYGELVTCLQTQNPKSPNFVGTIQNLLKLYEEANDNTLQHPEFYADLLYCLYEHQENSSSLVFKIQNLLEIYDNDDAFVALLPECLRALRLTFDQIKDPMNMTALHLAACNGYTKFVRLLFSAIGDDTYKIARCRGQNGTTPLHYAVDHGHTNFVKILVTGNLQEACKLLDILDGNLESPLHLAIRWGCTKIVKILLSVPNTMADVGNLINKTNGGGMNSLELARLMLARALPENKTKYQEIIDILEGCLIERCDGNNEQI